MNCPHCDVHIDEHEALPCLNAWVTEIIFGIENIRRHDLGGKRNPIEAYAVYSGGDDNAYATHWLNDPFHHYSSSIEAAKRASDEAGCIVVFAPNSAVRDGSYANRKKSWLVEMIPHKGTTNDSVWARAETEELARCRAAIKVIGVDNDKT